MMKRRPGGMGASSILMIFVVLALTTFGILSLLSARADLRLTKRAADHTAAYYAADQTVENTLAAIDDALVTARRETAALLETGQLQTSGLTAPDPALGQEEVYENLSRQLLASLPSVDLIDGFLEFSVPVGDGQQQIVTLLEILPLEDPMRTTVLRRVLRSTEESAEEAPLPVWPGNN